MILSVLSLFVLSWFFPSPFSILLFPFCLFVFFCFVSLFSLRYLPTMHVLQWTLPVLCDFASSGSSSTVENFILLASLLLNVSTPTAVSCSSSSDFYLPAILLPVCSLLFCLKFPKPPSNSFRLESVLFVWWKYNYWHKYQHLPSGTYKTNSFHGATLYGFSSLWMETASKHRLFWRLVGHLRQYTIIQLFKLLCSCSLWSIHSLSDRILIVIYKLKIL